MKETGFLVFLQVVGRLTSAFQDNSQVLELGSFAHPDPLILLDRMFFALRQKFPHSVQQVLPRLQLLRILEPSYIIEISDVRLFMPSISCKPMSIVCLISCMLFDSSTIRIS